MDEAKFLNELADEMTTAGRPATAGKLRAAAALLAASRPAPGYLRASEGQTFEDGETILCAVPLLPSGYDYCVLTVQCDEGLFRLTFDGEPWGWDWSDVEWWMPVPKAPAAESAKGGM